MHKKHLDSIQNNYLEKIKNLDNIIYLILIPCKKYINNLIYNILYIYLYLSYMLIENKI